MKSRLVLCIALAGTLASTVAFAQKNSTTGNYLTINGKAIPSVYESIFIQEQKARGGQDSPEMRKAIKDEIIRRSVLADEARKAGVDKKPDVAAQMDLAGQAILIRAFVGNYIQSSPVNDSEVAAEYERVKNLAGSVEYQVRHILVKTEDEAKDIIAKLNAGESFAKLASNSIDEGSKDRGGELGWNVPASFVEPFGAEMKRLEKGKYSEVPVKSEFGYHVVQIDDKRNATPPSLEEIRPGIEKRLQEAKVNNYIDGLIKKAKIQ